MSTDLLLDTHVLIWFLMGDPRGEAMMGREARDPGGTITVSAVSWFEIAIKSSVGKLNMRVGEVRPRVLAAGFLELPVTGSHAEQLALLPLHHTDPFDRLLIAQALGEGLTIATADAAFAAYDGLALHRPR
ncbi:MAG: type toxin-antitoxin system VapC family toxin [Thermoleophilia bacterium]|jgi:PIN domain nuclease of toxin-antitoxin system|nr:type toxin-antitoxin system VapC family toxin [Thermoleophilia bacterium]